MESKLTTRKASTMMSQKKGVGMITYVVGIVVGVILIVYVGYPIVTDAADNLTGTDATILAAGGTLLIVTILIMIARGME